jgi:hypothetical protein
MAKKRTAAPPKVVPITIDANGFGPNPNTPTHAIFGDFIRFDNMGDTDRAILYGLDGPDPTTFHPLYLVIPAYSSITVLTTEKTTGVVDPTNVYLKIRTKTKNGAITQTDRDDTYQVIISAS